MGCRHQWQPYREEGGTFAQFCMDCGERRAPCRVYWNTHGCCLDRGHDGPHMCTCAYDDDVDPETRLYPDGVLNVGAPPYYGEDTRFFGADAEEAVDASR